MESREVRRKSTRTVPVIIENHENAAKKTKLMVPSNYTAGQLVDILRSRMHLRPSHPVYLFLKSKQSPVLMSKSIGHLHHKHRDEKGLLQLIHAGQTLFGFRGNIRAIRFRQKWLENLHNTMHQSAGELQSYSGMSPSYFPLEPPTAANFGAPLDVDSLSDSGMSLIGNFYELEEYTEINEALIASDMVPWQSSNTTGSLQSALTTSSQSSALTNSSNSSILTNPWLQSPAINSGPTAGVSNPFMFINDPEEVNAFFLEMDSAIANLEDAAESGSSSVLATPNISANIQPPNVPNPNFVSLYESDSDWSDSDTDIDINL